MNEDQLDALAAAFLTLGRLHLAPPSKDTLSQLEQMYADWPLPVTGDTAVGLSEWQESFAAQEDVKTIARDLDLLYGRTATAKVAPYESVHRNRDGLVFDEETLQVREEYRQLGFEAPNLHREPDDHIGLEFDFIAQVIIRSLTATENDAKNDAERYIAVVWRFYTDHVGAWAPQMLRKAHDAAETKYIKGLQSLSIGALEHLVEALGIETAQ